MTKERVEKRLTHHGKPEHGRKEHERRETVDFTHISAEVFRTVLNTGHQRHKRGREHLRERRAAHLAPFVGLGVDSQGAKRIERAYHKRVYRKENSVEHRGAEHAQPYAPHLRERALFYPARRQPAPCGPKDAGLYAGKRHRLPHKCPRAVAGKGQPYAESAPGHLRYDV